MENIVYEVQLSKYILVGEKRETQKRDIEKETIGLYSELKEAKKHLLWEAGKNPEYKGNNKNSISIKEPIHHNEWESEEPEYKITEVKIIPHALRRYFLAFE